MSASSAPCQPSGLATARVLPKSPRLNRFARLAALVAAKLVAFNALVSRWRVAPPAPLAAACLPRQPSPIRVVRLCRRARGSRRSACGSAPDSRLGASVANRRAVSRSASVAARRLFPRSTPHEIGRSVSSPVQNGLHAIVSSLLARHWKEAAIRKPSAFCGGAETRRFRPFYPFYPLYP